eukprot:TRINITY_DN3985_c0_g1_i7.p1 TRINITY_DN3985_c0_g1~~TRINITY_DN3985_c0_g1_i7.p1  ORF type:complete len:235 (-),score=18.05 TRINITY_DN3985_c0_g1_i7:527-1177(-)
MDPSNDRLHNEAVVSTQSTGEQKLYETTRIVRRKRLPVNPGEVLWESFKLTGPSTVLIAALSTLTPKPLLYTAQASTYIFLVSLSYKYTQKRADLNREPMQPFVVGAVSGFSGGFVAGFLSGSFKILHTCLLGAVLGALFCHGLNRYDLWRLRRSNALLKRELDQLEQFRMDQESLGNDAFYVQHRNVKNWLPDWFPVRAVTDEEYEEYLAKKRGK